MKIGKELPMKFASTQQEAIIKVRITSNVISSVQNKTIGVFGISMAQFNILRILRGAKESLTINTVKERMIEKSPNTTRLLDKLLEKDLIEKTPCMEDRRQVYIQISNGGLDLLNQIDESSEFKALISSSLTNDEAEHLNTLLDKLRTSFCEH
jgi:MarR family 2-MHQ and catechol resistance regulon transcriptional repressor